MSESITPLRHAAQAKFAKAAYRLKGKPGMSPEDQLRNLKKARKAALKAAADLATAIDLVISKHPELSAQEDDEDEAGQPAELTAV